VSGRDRGSHIVSSSSITETIGGRWWMRRVGNPETDLHPDTKSLFYAFGASLSDQGLETESTNGKPTTRVVISRTYGIYETRHYGQPR